MINKPTDSKDRLIFALDVPDRESAMRTVKLLDGTVGMFKVGLELFVREGPQILQAIRDHTSSKIFLDLKLHDIPATVARAVRSACAHPVHFLTVHAAGGLPMMQEAAQAAAQASELNLLAVTVLTSMSEADLAPERGTGMGSLVLARAELARQAGCTGIVCSGQEVAAVKQQCGDSILTVVPGVRPAEGAVAEDDQRRTATPAQAITDGADYLVVGRPIRDAKDPRGAAQKIVEEIESARRNIV